MTTPLAAVAPPLSERINVPAPGFTVKTAVIVSPLKYEVVSAGVKVAVTVAVPDPTTVAVEPEMLSTPEFDDV